jgi:hypothetical protein
MAGQLRVDEITDEAGTGSPGFPNGITPSSLGTGTPDATNFLRGDGSWEAVPSATIASTAEAEAGTNNTNFITPLRMREGFNASGSAPVYACRAWVNFNGTTSPGTIRASGNVSSVTKTSTGRYVLNFSTAMPDANYAAIITADMDAGTSATASFGVTESGTGGYTTTSVRVKTVNSSAGFIDGSFINVSVFR